MIDKIKSKKTLVFCCAYGYKEVFLAINNIRTHEKISESISLGCTFGYHEEINECIELTKGYIILNSRYEEQLVEFKEPIISAYLNKECFLKCKGELSKKNKVYLSQLPSFYENELSRFFTVKSKPNNDKLSFCLPIGIRKQTPFIINEKGDCVDQPINVSIPIKSLFNKTIYPGDLFNTLKPKGFGYVCIIDNESVTFKSIEYPISNSIFYKALQKNLKNL